MGRNRRLETGATAVRWAVCGLLGWLAAAPALGQSPGDYPFQREEERPPVTLRNGPRDPREEKLIAAIERKLGRMKPIGASQKDLDDYYVIGTAELNLVDRHADVCFQALEGQRETAEYVYDYVAEAGQGRLRQWHVFSRVKDRETSEAQLAEIRRQYDEMQAYRSEIAQIYRARTTRRC